MRKNLYIIGAGGFGREVLAAAKEIETHQTEWKVKGFLNSAAYMDALDGLDTSGYIICESLEEHVITKDNVYVFAMADVKAKERICNEMVQKGARFVNLIHPSAIVANTANVGVGLIMFPFSSISVNTNIGDFVTINSHSDVSHDVNVGDYCTIGPRCSVLGHSTLKKGVTLGGSVNIHPNVEIGEYAIVGIGSVVISKVKNNTTVFGNPATRI